MIADGYQLLAELGAVDEGNGLTQIGWQLAKFPIDPRIARMILAAQREKCLPEMLVIASALSIQDPRERPFDRAEAADRAQEQFQEEKSDFIVVSEALELFRGSAQAQEIEPQADRASARAFSLAPAHARVARHPRAACGARG